MLSLPTRFVHTDTIITAIDNTNNHYTEFVVCGRYACIHRFMMDLSFIFTQRHSNFVASYAMIIPPAQRFTPKDRVMHNLPIGNKKCLYAFEHDEY